ncbi:MAG: metalloregulator ArsR/SmtB family transcription factor [Gammaproteobacteria bacterium]|uniref:metalloregulator ArsR/SmtB family transcription factor n=1 Tax=Pseudomaricurvus alcaniphilus TaxID=1166482 RepID=UPI001409970F|nr:metalloregulator ArsR/SmtB family transcription factor [Pseudomaricurvus alcaniphilus]MBR9912230.1 metalloregulator ArsR/SmtB family transcription factor [Gammaproteobacteria bacterium]NHN38706.1 metalloregulator ArsR/SmtB family transcription factor [Pseudomaricurvus alcaniphilus]
MTQQLHAELVAGPDLTHDLAATLKAASDPLRLEVLRLLARDSFGVMELSRIFAIKQSGMSHHLKVLATAGLVATRREGNSIYYRRALPEQRDPRRELLTSLFATLDLQPLSAEIQQRQGQVQVERARASQAFFTDNAGKFRAQQDLIASYPIYADVVTELLTKTPLTATGRALEVGPGEGEFLAVLAPRFQRVSALDNSASMLDKAATAARNAGLANIDFIHGDTRAALQRQLRADCVVANMVLHHVASPASVFDDIGKLLNPGGVLFITDLCHHDQQWAREACGDLWLGFEPDDLSGWAHQAGLEEGLSQYIALRNGFQIQVRQFFSPLRGTEHQEHNHYV